MVMRSGARRRLTGTALLAVAGVTAAGCGGSSKSGGGDAGSGTAAGKSAPAAVLIAAAGSGSSPKTVAVTAETVSEGAVEKVNGSLDFSAAALRADMAVTDAEPGEADKPTQMRVLVDGAKHYLSADAFRSQGADFAKALGTKQWVKTDTGRDLTAHENTPAAAFGMTALASDSDLLKALAAVFSSGVLKPDGAEGHYSGTVDAAALGASTFDEAHRAAVAAAMKDVSVTAEQIEIWLGPDGLPTRIKYTDTMSAGKKPSNGDVRFSDWGKPVRVALPAAADTMGFDDLQKALKAG